MLMFTAKEAKLEATNKMGTGRFFTTAQANVLTAVSQGLLHCDYYTPVDYSCTEKDIENLKAIAEIFNDYGFKSKVFVFTPNKLYSNTRVKIHFNWE